MEVTRGMEEPREGDNEVDQQEENDSPIGEHRSELKAVEELEEISIDPETPSRVVKVGKNLGDERKKELVEFLRKNLDVFA